jgi:dUTP pyrophosphatase
MRVKIFKSAPDLPTPAYKHDGDAGFDIYSNEDINVPGGGVVLVDTGIRIAVPYGYEAQIRLRSSYAKKSILIPNAPGTIDYGYKGPVMVALRNTHPHIAFHLSRGERFAQIVINELPLVKLKAVSKEEFFEDDTDRGEGGFGSTGKW